MPFWGRFTKQEPGKPIAARTLRTMAEQCEWIGHLAAEVPIEVISSGAGPLVRFLGDTFEVYIAVAAAGGISARAGAYPGTGNATLQSWDGNSFNNISGGITFPVFNWNSAAGGIPAGKYMVIMLIGGSYWVIAAECGP